MTRRTFLATLGKTAVASAVASAVPAWAAPYSDLELIARQQGAPMLVQLARAVERLTSTLTFMTTGAHPDDEPSAMLAALRYHYGISPVIYCITRGEGGQNNIGPERGIALGVLRTREMQEACRALDARLIFGGNDMHDSVHDFGFSKDPQDTLARWGEDIVVERMVRAIRTYRPDIVFNTFNNVPGQHGHHRASVLITDQAVALAAREDAFPEHFAEGLSVWQVAKLYDPAWGGGGSTYDDENPPPPVTLTLRAPERDAVTGATWPQIGEWSRACHLTQKMGKWIREPQTDWPLSLRHAAQGDAGRKEEDIRDALPATLGHMADWPGMNEACAQALRRAQASVEAVRAQSHDAAAVLAAAQDIAAALEDAEAHLPSALAPLFAHRLARKRQELDAVIALASGIHIRSYIHSKEGTQPVEIATLIDAPQHVVVKSVRTIARADLGVDNVDQEKSLVTIPPDAALTNPMPPAFDPLGGNGDAYTEVVLGVAGYDIVLRVDLEEALRIVPEASVRIQPDALVVNREHLQPLSLDVQLKQADMADLTLALPDHWQANVAEQLSAQHARFALTPPAQLTPARHAITPQLQGKPAYKVESFSYPHTGKVTVPSLADIPLQIVDARLPDAKVAYIGSNNDNVALWLNRLGVPLAELGAEDIAKQAYQEYDTLIIGVFAFGKRADLVAALPGIHQWVENGGHLLTLYHRPADGWNPEQVPPRYLKIGSPSIRYRVTDENAVVTHLVPDHPLLNTPNTITADDWANWDKERGLYFASEWDSAYVPLLAMNDPGEAPLEGALLSAEIGQGRHTHTALVLHHQLDKLTPGAFRLIANLIQGAKKPG